jgi:hypothetical protein
MVLAQKRQWTRTDVRSTLLISSPMEHRFSEHVVLTLPAGFDQSSLK